MTLSLTFDPLLSAAPAIQIHAAAAMAAIVLGPVALYRQRRDRLHRILGSLWVTLMVVVCLSSFFISGFGVIGPFSPLHLLALLALYGLWEAIRAIRMRDLATHRQIMRNLYWRGICLAGLFNFLPGRGMNRIFFEARPELGYVVLGLGLVALMLQILLPRWRGWMRRGRRAIS